MPQSNQIIHTMKSSIKFLILPLILLFYSADVRGEEVKTNSDGTGTIILMPTKNKGARTPSLIFIECRYSPAHISFIIPSDILFLEVTISNNDNVFWEGVVTWDNPDAIIPVLQTGEYTITCHTDGNQIYKGSFSF